MHRSAFRRILIRVSTVGVVVIGAITVAPSLHAADSENGRYSMIPTADGGLRLDSRTGAVSNCTKGPQGWSCNAVPDERAVLDGEIVRLQAEVDRLKGELAAGSRTEAAPDQAAGKTPPKAELALPSEQELDRMMTFVERAWRKLMGMANRLQKEGSGPI
ncbi:MAG: hypothetical protein FWD68_14890 [Alphaproteobacteria bacterium]|nr:hypothetical protein [Alphaproteobacteria bacterium]